MNIKDFKVGDKVIIVTNERDYVNGGRKDTIRTEKVVSVGRKYIQVTRFQNENFIDKFSAKDYFPDGLVEVVNIGSPDTYLFRTMKDYNDCIKRKELIRYVSDKFDRWSNNLTLEQLEAIKEIIECDKEN